jgi:hypothetical protein
MTICTLKVSLRSGANADGPWEAVIEIDSSALLEDLHSAIQDALGFDDDHLYEFFIATTERSRDRVRFDDENGYLYERTIESLHPLPDKKSLYYLFDYGDNWLFKVARIKSKEQAADPHARYPRVVREVGTTPTQYPDLDEEA